MAASCVGGMSKSVLPGEFRGGGVWLLACSIMIIVYFSRVPPGDQAEKAPKRSESRKCSEFQNKIYSIVIFAALYPFGDIFIKIIEQCYQDRRVQYGVFRVCVPSNLVNLFFDTFMPFLEL